MRWPSDSRRGRLPGVTFVEAAFFLFVLVITTGLVVQLVSVSVSVSSRLDAREATLRQTADLLDQLRTLVSEVTPPPWADPRTLARVEGGRILVRYYRGVVSQELSLEISRGLLVAQAQGLRWSWNPGVASTLRPWLSGDRTVGIEWVIEGEEPRVTRFAWGSQCL